MHRETIKQGTMKKEPIIKNQVYILMKDFMDYHAGDYFRGEERDQLVHVRSGQMWPATESLMHVVEITNEQYDEQKHGIYTPPTAEEMSQQIRSQMPSEKELFARIDRDLKRKQRALIFQGIGLLLRLLFEIAIVVAVIWLVVKQCNG